MSAKTKIEKQLAGLPPPDLTDPDNPEWSETEFAVAEGPEALSEAELAAFPKTNVGGRPALPADVRKQHVSIRLSPDNLEHYKAKGRLWQGELDRDLRLLRHLRAAAADRGVVLEHVAIDQLAHDLTRAIAPVEPANVAVWAGARHSVSTRALVVGTHQEAAAVAKAAARGRLKGAMKAVLSPDPAKGETIVARKSSAALLPKSAVGSVEVPVGRTAPAPGSMLKKR